VTRAYIKYGRPHGPEFDDPLDDAWWLYYTDADGNRLIANLSADLGYPAHVSVEDLVAEARAYTQESLVVEVLHYVDEGKSL